MKTRITEIFAIKHPIIQGGIQSRSNLPNFFVRFDPNVASRWSDWPPSKEKSVFYLDIDLNLAYI